MTRRPRQPPPRPHALGRDQWTGTMSAPTTPRAELAAAVRAVNAAERRLPGDRRIDLASEWNQVARLLKGGLLDGDRDEALAAIGRWRDSFLASLEEPVSEHISKARKRPEASYPSRQQLLDWGMRACQGPGCKVVIGPVLFERGLCSHCSRRIERKGKR